jgi:hypothetical protein
MLKNRYKYISTTFNKKARDFINSNRFRWSQALNGFKNVQSQTGTKDKNSDDDEWIGKTTGRGLFYLYTD